MATAGIKRTSTSAFGLDEPFDLFYTKRTRRDNELDWPMYQNNFNNNNNNNGNGTSYTFGFDTDIPPFLASFTSEPSAQHNQDLRHGGNIFREEEVNPGHQLSSSAFPPFMSSQVEDTVEVNLGNGRTAPEHNVPPPPPTLLTHHSLSAFSSSSSSSSSSSTSSVASGTPYLAHQYSAPPHLIRSPHDADEDYWAMVASALGSNEQEGGFFSHHGQGNTGAALHSSQASRSFEPPLHLMQERSISAPAAAMIKHEQEEQTISSEDLDHLHQHDEHAVKEEPKSPSNSSVSSNNPNVTGSHNGDGTFTGHSEPIVRTSYLAINQSGLAYQIFMRHVQQDNENDTADASQVFSKQCFEEWLNTRLTPLKNPFESYRRALLAHVTGLDGRKPFPPSVEQDILRIVRISSIWPCFEGHTLPNGRPVQVGIYGFRGYGYWEKNAASHSQDVKTETEDSRMHRHFSR